MWTDITPFNKSFKVDYRHGVKCKTKKKLEENIANKLDAFGFR